MTIANRLLSLVTLFATLSVSGQYAIEVIPPDPTSMVPVVLMVLEYDSCPPDPVVTRNGFTITVALGQGPCLSPPGPVTHRVDLGVLEPGSYLVQVTDTGEPVASASFVVREQNFAVIVRPSVGPAGGSTPVLIQSHINMCPASGPCAPPTITFGGVPATNVEVISGTEFRAIAPPHAPGVVEVRVQGAFDVRTTAFRYYDPAEPPLAALFERLLIPVIYDGPGRRGSQWVTEVSIRNTNDWVVGAWNGRGASAAISPGAAIRADLGQAPHGLFLVIPREAFPGLGVNVLVRDTSGEAGGWGTELPVVRDHDWVSAFDLLNVPFDARYRVTLRIYGREAATAARVTVHTIEGPGPTSFSRVIRLSCDDSVCAADTPAFAALDLSTQLSGPGRYGVRVQSIPDQPIWGFVTVTDNETQHVTVISAQ